MPTKKRRVFIAVPCSKTVRDLIAAYQRRWAFLPVRWIPPENLHLTLVPPSYLSDDELVGMIAAARAAVGNISPFEISFDRFVFAPPGKPGRMIWLVGPARAELQRLKKVVEEAIGARGENRQLLPHITIARMREQEWRRYAPKPAAEEQLKVEMPVTEIAFMESTLKRSGAEYSLLAHIALAE